MPDLTLGNNFLNVLRSTCDNNQSSSSSSNVVSRRIPRALSSFRARHIHIHHYPRSFISSHMSLICNYMNDRQAPARLKEIIKSTHAQYLSSIPHGLLECLSSKKIFMGLGYRFKPGHPNFLMHDFKIPACLDRFKILYESLGFSMRKNTSSIREFFMFSRQDGMKSAVDANYYKNLVEVLTLFNGTFGRFLILTCAGLGCTVWYSFSPGGDGIPASLFAPIVSYDPFFNMDYTAPEFQSVGFTETMNIADQIRSAYSPAEGVRPFAEIEVPASGVVLQGVCLGIVIAFFMTVGIIDVTNVIIQ